MPAYNDPWENLGGQTRPLDRQAGFTFAPLADIINDVSTQVKQKIASMRENQDNMSIGDVFDLQHQMNQLSQYSTMATEITSAVHNSILGTLRNLK